MQDGSKSNLKQNHVSFPEFAQNGSAKQFANGTNLNDKTNTNIIIVDNTNNTSHESFENDFESSNDPKSHCKKIRHNKTKRKYSHSLSKYRRLELGNVLFFWQKKDVFSTFFFFCFLYWFLLYVVTAWSIIILTFSFIGLKR